MTIRGGLVIIIVQESQFFFLYIQLYTKEKIFSLLRWGLGMTLKSISF